MNIIKIFCIFRLFLLFLSVNLYIFFELIENNMKKLSNLLKKLSYTEIINFVERNISAISYDSRLVSSDTLFVAMKGTKVDAHNYIPDVIKQGCKTIVCEKVPDSYDDVTFIRVDNSRQTLAEISHWWFDYPTRFMKMIGVTGTNGKTTTTFLIAQILERMGLKVGIIGTTGIYFLNRFYNATHTTPESFELCRIFKEMATNGVQCVVMEVSSHSLEQKRVFGIDFDVAVFTNLTHDHLDYHLNMENYASAKKILFDNLKSDAIAVLQGDSEWAKLMISDCKCENIAFVGRNNLNKYIIQNERIMLNGISFNLSTDTLNLDIKTSLLGKFNIDNSSLAVAACIELGYNPYDVAAAMKEVAPAEGRMSSIQLRTGAIGIVDYAHTPDAIEKALLTCREILQNSGHNNSKLICVFGCGGDRDRTKRPKMGEIASQIADIVIITDDNPRTEDPASIRKEILQGIPEENKSKVLEIAERAEAIRYAVDVSGNGDIVLVAGKGHEKYQIIGQTRFHFDDFEHLKKM